MGRREGWRRLPRVSGPRRRPHPPPLSGLQWQPPAQAPAAAEPVENVLERALVAAGAIIPSNAGRPAKVGWTRSSRTDRGVHAAPAVIALRAECDPASFAGDPEGAAFAAAVNARLPPAVRVFAAQRVSGGWCARSMCEGRAYEYALPAAALGADTGAGLERFRAVLSLYSPGAALPFHCFTKRAEYRGAGRRAGGRVRIPRGAGARDEGGGEGEAAAPTPSPPPPLPAPDRPPRPRDPDAPLPVRPHWHGDGAPDGDGVGPAHWRTVARACAADPAPLTPGGPDAVVISLDGSSFMLHQIRHMVGAAVAVARGALPLGAVAAALCAPARVALPLAPPHTLTLVGARFGRYPAEALGGEAAPWVGDRLELRESGAAAASAWRASTLAPALSALLTHADWAEWDRVLDRLTYDGGDMRAFVAAGEAWAAAAPARAAARAERAAAAVAAGE